MLELLRRWGAKQSQGMSVEFVDAERQLPIAFRNTIANMMAEAEALNGIFAAGRRSPTPGTGASGIGPTALSADRARAPTPVYEIDETLTLSEIAPMIAKPFAPGNAFPAEEVARERLDVRQGDDRLLHQRRLRRPALGRARAEGRARGRLPRRWRRPSRSSRARAASGARSRSRIRAWRGESIAEVFRTAGGQIRQSWCGPCFGQGPDALTKGQRAITSFNRNWQNRMGYGGEGFLASPAVVAASALAGYMAPPGELGLAWSAERFGV